MSGRSLSGLYTSLLAVDVRVDATAILLTLTRLPSRLFCDWKKTVYFHKIIQAQISLELRSYFFRYKHKLHSSTQRLTVVKIYKLYNMSEHVSQQYHTTRTFLMQHYNSMRCNVCLNGRNQHEVHVEGLLPENDDYYLQLLSNHRILTF